MWSSLPATNDAVLMKAFLGVFQHIFVFVLLPSVLMPGKLGIKKDNQLKQLSYHTLNSSLKPRFPFRHHCIWNW